MTKKVAGHLILPEDPKPLASFLSQPYLEIAKAITGIIAEGPTAALVAGGRVVQAAITGKAMKQFAQELQIFIEEGKIPEDYVNTKYGFQSLGDLLKFIDDEAPEEEKLEAIKLMFYVLNAAEGGKADEMLKYRLFKMSMSLTASQMLLLKTCYEIYKNHEAIPSGAQEWLQLVAKKLSVKVTTLVQQDEKALVELEFLTPRVYPDKSGITPHNARLTDLGIAFYEYLDEGVSKFR